MHDVNHKSASKAAARLFRIDSPAITLADSTAHIVVDDAEVVAVAAREQARAQAFAASYNLPRACEGYEQLLQDPAIDALEAPLAGAA